MKDAYDVVVLAAHGVLGALRAGPGPDERERAALETDLADDVLDVETEDVEKGGACSGVGLGREYC